MTDLVPNEFDGPAPTPTQQPSQATSSAGAQSSHAVHLENLPPSSDQGGSKAASDGAGTFPAQQQQPDHEQEGNSTGCGSRPRNTEDVVEVEPRDEPPDDDDDRQNAAVQQLSTLLKEEPLSTGVASTAVTKMKSNLSSPNSAKNKSPKNVSFQSRVSVVQVESVKQVQSDRRRPDPDGEGICCGSGAGLVHTPPRNVVDVQGQVVRLNLIYVTRPTTFHGAPSGLRELDLLHVPKPLRQKGVPMDVWRQIMGKLELVQRKHIFPWIIPGWMKKWTKERATQWSSDLAEWEHHANHLLDPFGVSLKIFSHCEPNQSGIFKFQRTFLFVYSEWTYTVFTPRAAQKKVEQRVGEVMKGPDGKWGTGNEQQHQPMSFNDFATKGRTAASGRRAALGGGASAPQSSVLKNVDVDALKEYIGPERLRAPAGPGNPDPKQRTRKQTNIFKGSRGREGKQTKGSGRSTSRAARKDLPEKKASAGVYNYNVAGGKLKERRSRKKYFYRNKDGKKKYFFGRRFGKSASTKNLAGNYSVADRDNGGGYASDKYYKEAGALYFQEGVKH
eukprot:g17276.t1